MTEPTAATRKGIEFDPLRSEGWDQLSYYLMFIGDFVGAREANRRDLEISPESAFALSNLGTL
jgi:Flp pilus assembly protein TadD